MVKLHILLYLLLHVVELVTPALHSGQYADGHYWSCRDGFHKSPRGGASGAQKCSEVLMVSQRTRLVCKQSVLTVVTAHSPECD